MQSLKFIDPQMEQAAEKLMKLKIQKKLIDKEIKELEPYAILCLESYNDHKLREGDYTLSISNAPTRYDFSTSEEWNTVSARKQYIEKCMKLSHKDDMMIVDDVTGEIVVKPKVIDGGKITKLTKK